MKLPAPTKTQELINRIPLFFALALVLVVPICSLGIGPKIVHTAHGMKVKVINRSATEVTDFLIKGIKGTYSQKSLRSGASENFFLPRDSYYLFEINYTEPNGHHMQKVDAQSLFSAELFIEPNYSLNINAITAGPREALNE